MPRTFRRSLTSTLVSRRRHRNRRPRPDAPPPRPRSRRSSTTTSGRRWLQTPSPGRRRRLGHRGRGGTWTHAGAATNYKVNGSAGLDHGAEGRLDALLLPQRRLLDRHRRHGLDLRGQAARPAREATSRSSDAGSAPSTTAPRSGSRPTRRSRSRCSTAATSVGSVTHPGHARRRHQAHGPHPGRRGRAPPPCAPRSGWRAPPSRAAWTLEGVSASAGTAGRQRSVSAPTCPARSTNAPITFTFDDFAVTTTKPVAGGQLRPDRRTSARRSPT